MGFGDGRLMIPDLLPDFDLLLFSSQTVSLNQLVTLLKQYLYLLAILQPQLAQIIGQWSQLILDLLLELELGLLRTILSLSLLTIKRSTHHKGANHIKYMPFIMALSIIFSLAVGFGFGIIPIYLSFAG